jgi:hypothetical protein
VHGTGLRLVKSLECSIRDGWLARCEVALEVDEATKSSVKTLEYLDCAEELRVLR